MSKFQYFKRFIYYPLHLNTTVVYIYYIQIKSPLSISHPTSSRAQYKLITVLNINNLRVNRSFKAFCIILLWNMRNSNPQWTMSLTTIVSVFCGFQTMHESFFQRTRSVPFRQRLVHSAGCSCRRRANSAAVERIVESNKHSNCRRYHRQITDNSRCQRFPSAECDREKGNARLLRLNSDDYMLYNVQTINK